MKFDCLQKILENLFYKYGKLVARFPHPFIGIPVLITIILSLGLLNIQRIDDAEFLYTPTNGPAKDERSIIQNLFQENETHYFLPTRRTILDGALQVIVTNKAGGNVYSQNAFNEILALDQLVRDVIISEDGIFYGYSELCAAWNEICFDNTVLMILNTTAYNVTQSNLTYPYHQMPGSLEPLFIGNQLGGVTLKEDNITVDEFQALYLVYFVRYQSVTEQSLSDAFLRKGIQDLLSFESNEIVAHFQSSLSLDDELTKATDSIVILFSITYTILTLFASLSCNMMDPVRSKAWVATGGEIAAAMAILSSLGLLSFAGVPFTSTVGSVPFLIMGIGIDDMFVIVSAWRHTSFTWSVEERMGKTFETAAISITVTSITDGLAFAIGSITTFRAVTYFCAYAGAAVLFSYIYAITFCAACLAYSGKLEHQNRHSTAVCIQVTPKDDEELNSKSGCYKALCVGGHAIHLQKEPQFKYNNQTGLVCVESQDKEKPDSLQLQYNANEPDFKKPFSNNTLDSNHASIVDHKYVEGKHIFDPHAATIENSNNNNNKEASVINSSNNKESIDEAKKQGTSQKSKSNPVSNITTQNIRLKSARPISARVNYKITANQNKGKNSTTSKTNSLVKSTKSVARISHQSSNVLGKTSRVDSPSKTIEQTAEKANTENKSQSKPILSGETSHADGEKHWLEMQEKIAAEELFSKSEPVKPNIKQSKSEQVKPNVKQSKSEPVKTNVKQSKSEPVKPNVKQSKSEPVKPNVEQIQVQSNESDDKHAEIARAQYYHDDENKSEHKHNFEKSITHPDLFSVPLLTELIHKYISVFILKPTVKCVVLILYIIYIGFSIWGCVTLTEGLHVKNLAPDNSYVIDFYDQFDNLFYNKYGPPMMVVFTDSLDYSNVTVQNAINNQLEIFRNGSFFQSEDTLTESWLAGFLTYLQIANIPPPSDMPTFVTTLQQFLQFADTFRVDIVFSDDNTAILSSRFMIQANGITNSLDERDLMLQARDIAENSKFSLAVFHPGFIFYDQYVVILQNTLQNLGIAVLCMIFVSVFLLPSLIGVIFVTLSVVSICAGVIGFMVFWDVNLDSISMINLVMCIGFSVDFSAHISYHFSVSKHESGDAKARDALTYIGMPIIQGALSTILGVVVLATSETYIFRTFFKLMFLVMVFGFLHAFFILPVVLALFGSPKCTKKCLNSDGLKLGQVNNNDHATDQGNDNHGYVKDGKSDVV